MALQGYRAEVRRTFEATEEIFAADMKWRDDWVEGRKKERRNERRKAKNALKHEEEEGTEEESLGGQGGSAKQGGRRIFPEEEEGARSSPGREAPKTEDRCSGRAVQEEGDASGGQRVLAEEEGQLLSGDFSSAKQHHPAQDDEGIRGAEEGLLTSSLGTQAIEGVPENTRGESAGITTSPGSRRRSTRSNGWRRSSRHSTFNNLETFAGEEAGGGVGEAPGKDRTRGPCQGSGLWYVPKQEPDKQRRQELLEGDLPPSVSNVGATEERTLSFATVPGQETEEVVERDGAPGRTGGHSDRAE